MSNARSVAEHRLNLTILEQRSRSWRIAFALLLCLAGWYYYATIDGSFRRPSTAAFTPPSFLANEVTRPIGASWQAVSVTSNDRTGTPECKAARGASKEPGPQSVAASPNALACDTASSVTEPISSLSRDWLCQALAASRTPRRSWHHR